MSDIVLSAPTLEELIGQVKDVRQLVVTRRASGWPLFMDDETWTYYAKSDFHTCDVCEEFHYIGKFSGPEVLTKFPQWSRTGDQYTIMPNVHDDPRYSFLYEKCRCIMTMDNPLETLRDRLAKEIEAIAG